MLLDGLRIAVYTVITGNYDDLKPWPGQTIPVDVYCITDNPSIKIPSTSEPITILKIGQSLRPTTNPVCIPFSYRLFPYDIPEFNDYDLLVYLDGNVCVTDKKWIERLLTTYPVLSNGVSMIEHPIRDCVYQELEICKTISKYDRTMDLDQQINTYKANGLPMNFGLWANNVIFWNRHVEQDQIKNFQEFWFKETQNYRREGIQVCYPQGQATLVYSLWTLSLCLCKIPKKEWQRGYIIRKHSKMAK